jgi:hypothetical protein
MGFEFKNFAISKFMFEKSLGYECVHLKKNSNVKNIMSRPLYEGGNK